MPPAVLAELRLRAVYPQLPRYGLATEVPCVDYGLLNKLQMLN